MHDDRRQWPRGTIQGTVLIYDSSVETTKLLDIGLGGMKVCGRHDFSNEEPFWVEFTFVDGENKMVFGKRAQARLVHSEFDQEKRRYVVGFQFLSLTEFQRHVINNALGH